MSDIEDFEYTQYRRRRVQRLKKIIVGTIIAAILIPLTVSVIFIVMYVRTNSELKSLQEEYDELLSTVEKLKDTTEEVSGEQDVYSVSPVQDSARTEDSGLSEQGLEEDTEPDADTRKVYLTFDDGPSSNTSRILDVLDEYGVKATFFVVGKTDDVSVAAYKRIVEDGHTLGMHSYSHRYSDIYASEEAFAEDLTELQEYLYELTGVWSRYYRFPGGSSNTTSKVDMKVLIDYLDKLDITYYDWNIVSGDATSPGLSADAIYQNCISGLEDYSNAVILMHDAQARDTTVEALPRIIEYIQALPDTEILPITDDTVPVQHRTVDD